MTRLKVFSTFVLLCVVIQGGWAWTGSGTESNPYQINTVDDWNTLCTNVNKGSSTYQDKFFKLMADITVEETCNGAPTKMVGRGENVNFRGTFDGNGHKLTVNYVDNNNDNACAPFRFIRNATIKNLHVTGKITKNYKKFAGGLVGVAYGTCHISNCHSTVEIVCHDGDCSSGGFIGELGTSNDPDDTYIDNCFFDGRLQGDKSNKWGGFIGWVEDEPDAYITNCLFSPAYVYVDIEGSKTFVRGDDIHITNCYYKYLLTDAQGATKARDMDNETLRMKLGEAWEVFAGQVLPVMTPRPLINGMGTEQSPYLIATLDDWHRLATNVALGESYYGKHFLMTRDISVSRVVGTHPGGDTYNAFQGIFDGDGHTLTVNYTTNAEFCGPFCYTYGATIKNLITTGTINTSHKHASGVVGRNGTARLTLSNVMSSMTINSTFRGSAEHGGLVGYAINADITGSSFTGSLLGENSTGCGGLIGWKTNTGNSSVNITDCLFAPTSVTVGTTNAYNLVRNSSGGVVNITNSYYTQPFGTSQGKHARSIIAGEHVTMENAGTLAEYPISGITSYGVGIKYNDVLYAGLGDAVSLTLSYIWTDGFEGEGFHASAGELVGNENTYTLTMPDDDVLVYASINANPWEGEGTEASPYLISYISQWDLLAERVAVGTDYSGKHFQLANDITVSRMVGIDGQHAFNGTFSGGGHTLTLDYSATADYAAPFRFVNGATIHDLTVDGTINSSKKFAAGIIGQAAGKVTINHCRSHVTINSSVNGDGTNGGFVGVMQSGETTISGSLFDGSLLGQLTNNNAGFVGWTTNGDSLRIENSIFAPSKVTMHGEKTFARCNSGEHPAITNSFYTETFGDVQGKRIYKTEQEVADNGLYYTLTAFDQTYYGKVIVTMQVAFDQTDEEIKPVATIMTEDGILIPNEGIYTLDCRHDEVTDNYTITVMAVASAPFPIPNAQLVGSKTFEYTVVGMYAPKGLTATTTCNTATINWTGAAERYKLRYRPTILNPDYFTGFENGLPDGWTTIDADGDGKCWDVTRDIPEYAHGGAVFMSSASYLNDEGVLTPDNWLVSPRLPLNGILKVWMKGQDTNDFQEHVAIYVSTTGNTVADFTDIVLPETVVTNEYTEYTANLSQYAGEQGYIAIRHFNCTDQYRLDVDDFGLYVANSPSGEWQEIDVTGTEAVINGLQPGTDYAYQVVGIVDEKSYPSAVAVMQTEEDVPKVTHVSVAPEQTTAQVSWEGYGRSFNLRYALDMAAENTAKVTLTVGDVWEDGSGYQMLLDADANTFGSIIPYKGPISDKGDVPADDYAKFEYKIPEDADGALTTHNIVLNNSVTIDIPAGTYDWCITNPSPELEMMFIASGHGNIGGRKDNYVFEAGMHYMFNVSLDGDYDRVDVGALPMYGEWTQVTVDNSEQLTTLLISLTKNTKYVVQVQAVLANGKTSEWSPVEKFTTLGEGEIVLYDDFDNQDVIDENADKEVNVTLQGRKLYKNNKWNALSLPFDTELTGVLANATLMELDTEVGSYEHVTGFENGTLYLNFKPANTIEAGKPYIIKWTNTKEVIENPVFEGVTIVGDAPGSFTSKDGAVSFTGNYNLVSFGNEGDNSKLYLGTDNKLHHPDNNLTIGSCRAYFQLGNGASLVGDVNHDGNVNISDVVRLVNIILSDGTEENSSADVNKNGDIDISDVVRLVNIILSDESPTPPEITTIITNVGIDY